MNPWRRAREADDALVHAARRIVELEDHVEEQTRLIARLRDDIRKHQGWVGLLDDTDEIPVYPRAYVKDADEAKFGYEVGAT